MRPFCVLLAVFVVCSCGAEQPSLHRTPAVTAVALRAPFAARMRQRVPLMAGATIRAAARGAFAGSALDVALPSDARGVTHISTGDVSLEIEPLDLSPSPVALVEGTAVYRDAAPHTDVVDVVGRDWLEEIRWLRHPSAPHTLRWRLRSTSAVTLRGGRIELCDGEGIVRLASEPMFVVDAAGVRRDVALRLDRDGDGFAMTAAVDDEGLRYPLAVDPLWSVATPPPYGFTSAGAVKLASGDHLFVSNNAATVNAATAVWSTAGAPSIARGSASLTLLPSGKVLAAGGPAEEDASTELFDPGTRTWSAGSPMPSSRGRHNALLLAAGKVLVTGGSDASDALSTAALFDVASATWTTTGSMAHPRLGHGMVELPGGRVLVAGGHNTEVASEIWSGSTWATGPAMTTARRTPISANLLDGRLLVAGGERPAPAYSTAEIYNPATNTFTATPAMNSGHWLAAAAVLTSGRVLVAGGDNSSAAEIYDPASNAWYPVGNMAAPRTDGRAIALSNDRALIVGGYNSGGWLTSAELFAAAADGSLCTAPGDCRSLHCVDGVCCDTACDGQCSSCAQSGSVGTCRAIVGAPLGGRIACDEGGENPCQTKTCNGVDGAACHFVGAAVACGEATCTSGVESHVATCNGAGTCGDVARPCGAYRCGDVACKTGCTSKADCAAGFYCNGGACSAVVGLGATCSDASACSAGLFCTDGVCCGVPSCGSGASCSAGPTKGSCIKLKGSLCAAGAECLTGTCVDGVCCDRACDGACEACDVALNVGTCTPVVGKPHGARAACPADPAGVCGRIACDGVTTASCTAVASTDVSCREQSCRDGIVEAGARCDGKGACPTPVRSSCGGLACAPDAKSCLTTCTAGTDCIAGHECNGGKCTPRISSCSDDGTSVVGADSVPHTCAPYFCVDNDCATRCASTSECVSNHVCDVTNGTCVASAAVAAPEEDSGGCSMSSSRGGGGAFLFAFLATMIGIRRRRALASAAVVFLSASCHARGDSVPVHPSILSRLSGLELTADENGYAAPSAHFGRDGSIRVGALEIVPRVSSLPRMTGRSLVFDNAERDTDIVLVAVDGGAEELRVLRSLRAPHRATYELRFGDELASARVVGDRVEVLDRAGVVRVATEPLFAVDAVGTRRVPTAAISHDDARSVLTIDLDIAGLVPPIVVDPTWLVVGSIPGSYGHTATKLIDGRVLVVGGMPTSSSVTATARIYDPTTDSWSTTGSLAEARFAHGAARLPSGKVLIAGGQYRGVATYEERSTTEVFDPGTGSFSAGPSLPAPRSNLTAAVLESGEVVFAGARDTTSTLLIYSPTLDAWRSSSPPGIARNAAVTLAIPGNRVLLLGGGTSSGSVSAIERYDVPSNTWTTIASIPASWRHAVLLPGGKVLLCGGDAPTAFVFDPVTTAATKVPNLTEKRSNGGGATLTSAGHVLVAGGWNFVVSRGVEVSTAEAFDPVRGSWAPMGTMAIARSAPTVTALPNGGALVVGGTYATPGAERVAADPNGTACTGSARCRSGFCADGVCCDTACTDRCAACNLTGRIGACSPVTGVPVAPRKACPGGGTDACKAQSCNGFDPAACHLVGGSTTCGVASCTDGIETHASTCDGAGKCSDAPTSCGAYGCGATACKSTCAAKSDCAAGYFCSAGACVPVVGLGAVCADTGSCNPGLYCTDSVCCVSASCGAGASCSAGPRKGTCSKALGAACTTNAECGSGFCADSVCCESACTDQCAACNAGGSCAAVVGAPRGERPACAADATDACASAVCDGVDRAKCAGRVGAEVVCRAQSCADGRMTLSAACDAKGGCPAAIEVSCGGFACDGSACRTTCTSASECTGGRECVGERCRVPTRACSADGMSVIDPSGATKSCAPSICRAGRCVATCAGTADCAPGNVCDSTAGQCVPVPAASEESGCAFKSPVRSSSAVAGCALLVALSLLVRRSAAARAERRIRPLSPTLTARTR